MTDVAGFSAAACNLMQISGIELADPKARQSPSWLAPQGLSGCRNVHH